MAEIRPIGFEIFLLLLGVGCGVSNGELQGETMYFVLLSLGPNDSRHGAQGGKFRNHLGHFY